MDARQVPEPILVHWYVCGRKVQLATETIAHLYKPWRPAYHCPFGDHWHVGRAQVRTPGRFNRPRRRNAWKAWDERHGGVA